MKKNTTGFFITGTDTGVGKTWIAGGLARILRSRGLNLGVWKPVQCGALPGNPEADSRLLKERSGVDDPEDMITPCSFAAPLAPLVAGLLENRRVDVTGMLAVGQPLGEKYAFLLVEGAGGLAVPLNEREMVADFAARLGYPIIIVARPGLGTINHTLLTVEYARSRGLSIFGVIFNGYHGETPPEVASLTNLLQTSAGRDSEWTNPAIVNMFAQVPVIGTVPRLAADADLSQQIDSINANVAIDRLVASLAC